MAGLFSQAASIGSIQKSNAAMLETFDAFTIHIMNRLECAPWHYGPNRPMNCYMVSLLPHAACLGMAAGDIEIACIAKMISNTLWDFMGEKLGIVKESLPQGDEGCLVVDDNRETGSEPHVVKGTRVRIYFLRVPHDLQLPFESEEMDIILPNMPLLVRIKDANRLRKNLHTLAEKNGNVLKGDPPECTVPMYTGVRFYRKGCHLILLSRGCFVRSSCTREEECQSVSEAEVRYFRNSNW